MKINLYACAAFALSLFLTSNANGQISNVGLVAHWMFDGNAADSSGNGNHGTVNNITYTAGISGQPNTAAVFDGSTSYITVPYSPGLNLTNYSICAKVWINSFYTGTCQVNMILQRGVSYANGNYALWFADTITDCSPATVDTGAYTLVTETGPNNLSMPGNTWWYKPTLRTGRWYSIVATWNDSIVRIYMNGQLIHTAAPSPVSVIGSSTDGLAIGAAYNYGLAPNSTWPYWFSGKMDDLRIYARVLADSEIRTYAAYPVTVDKVITKSILQAYPNPNSGTFQVSAIMHTSGDAILEVFDIVGKIVYTETVPIYNNAISKHVNLANIDNGTYLLRIRSSVDVATQVITIKK